MIKLFEADTMKEVGKSFTHKNPASNAQFSDDGSVLAILNEDGEVQLLKWATKRTILLPPLPKGTLISKIALSPDGTMILMSDLRGQIGCYQIQEKTWLPLEKFSVGTVNQLLFSKDSSKIILHGNKNLIIYDLNSNRETLNRDSHWVEEPTLTPDGKYLAIADLSKHQVSQIELETGAATAKDFSLQVQSIHFSADGSRQVVVEDNKITLLEPTGPQDGVTWVTPDEKRINFSELTPDGRYLLLDLEDTGVQLLNLDLLAEVKSPFDTSVVFMRAAATPDSQRIILSDDDGNMYFWFVRAEDAKQFQRNKQTP